MREQRRKFANKQLKKALKYIIIPDAVVVGLTSLLSLLNMLENGNIELKRFLMVACIICLRTVINICLYWISEYRNGK